MAKATVMIIIAVASCWARRAASPAPVQNPAW